MKWIFEYEIFWLDDGVTSKEQTLNINAPDKAQAIEEGKRQVAKLDEDANCQFEIRSSRFYRCVQENEFSYNSSAKDRFPSGGGHIDVTRKGNCL